MAYLIQQTDDAVNILDTSKPSGEQILFVFNPINAFPKIVEDKIRISNAAKTQDFTTDIAGLMIQQIGGAAVVWVGTNDALLALVSSFFDIANSGGATAANQVLEISATEQLGKQSFLSQVALLRVAGVKNFRKQGENAVVSTSVLPINQGGTPIVPLVSDVNISFVSNSINDTALGTGARTLRIFGVGVGGVEQSEDLILNGTTPVLTALKYVGILNRVLVLTVGGGATKSNIGTITGTSGGNTYCTILAGDSVMKQIAYYVPNNKTACIYSYLIDASKNAATSVDFDVHFYVLQNGVKYELFSFKINQSTGFDNSVQRIFQTPLPITENSIWWFEAKVSSGTAILTGEVEQIIFDDL